MGSVQDQARRMTSTGLIPPARWNALIETIERQQIEPSEDIGIRQGRSGRTLFLKRRHPRFRTRCRWELEPIYEANAITGVIVHLGTVYGFESPAATSKAFSSTLHQASTDPQDWFLAAGSGDFVYVKVELTRTEFEVDAQNPDNAAETTGTVTCWVVQDTVEVLAQSEEAEDEIDWDGGTATIYYRIGVLGTPAGGGPVVALTKDGIDGQDLCSDIFVTFDKAPEWDSDLEEFFTDLITDVECSNVDVYTQRLTFAKRRLKFLAKCVPIAADAGDPSGWEAPPAGEGDCNKDLGDEVCDIEHTIPGEDTVPPPPTAEGYYVWCQGPSGGEWVDIFTIIDGGSGGGGGGP